MPVCIAGLYRAKTGGLTPPETVTAVYLAGVGFSEGQNLTKAGLAGSRTTG
jgi:hypothetical protein